MHWQVRQTLEHHGAGLTAYAPALILDSKGENDVEGFTFVFFTENYAASVGFYTDGLGLPTVGGWDRGPADKGTMFRAASGVIEVIHRSGVVSSPPVGAWFSFQVNDVEGLYKRAREKGLQVVEELSSKPWGALQFKVQDPNGIVLAPYSLTGETSAPKKP